MSKLLKKIIYFIRNPLYILIRLDNKNIIRLNDKLYIKLKYKEKMHKKLDLKNPQTFNEKLQYLKLHDRKDIYTTMVDKYEAKKYVANIIGEQYIIPTLGVYESFDEINFDQLPNQFVIKCTHDSGGLLVVKNKADFNIKSAKEKINKCLKTNYYYSGREWPYKNVKHKIIIEKYMTNKLSEELIDYKIMCFNGKAKIIFTCSERYSDGLKVTFFDLEWNKLPFKRHYPISTKKIKKPTNLDKMIELSEKLAKNIKFVRMDWYEINDKIYFGEYTFYPGDGLEEFEPEKWDKKIGDLIKI